MSLIELLSLSRRWDGNMWNISKNVLYKKNFSCGKLWTLYWLWGFCNFSAILNW
uniref:Uncharacterized protein n=1 Tax=Rhizophora mucronata TaxID=61149 RepID=A0A2P2LS21_RHIMU